jgi:hypothetical protein
VAGILKIASLAERKQALAEESEAYRQMLHVQVRNVQLYSLSVREKFRSFNSSNPLLLLAFPLLARLVGRSVAKRSAFARFKWLGTAVTLWPVAKRIMPLAFRFLARRRVMSRMQAEPETRVPASVI